MKKSPRQWGVAPQGFLFYALMHGVKDSYIDCDALNKGRRTAPSKQNKQKIWLFLSRGIITPVKIKNHPFRAFLFDLIFGFIIACYNVCTKEMPFE